jgi:hypothetical protein
MLRTATVLDREGRHASVAQAWEKRLREVVTGGRFPEFRRAIETPPFDMGFEAKP